MKTFCVDNQKDWDDGVHILLFAARESFHESLRFSPFGLVFWTLCGRSLLKENWLCENTVISILDYVEWFMCKFTRACKIEQDKLKQNQAMMKQWYDTDALIIQFNSGEKVIVLLLIHCHPLQALFRDRL